MPDHTSTTFLCWQDEVPVLGDILRVGRLILDDAEQIQYDLQKFDEKTFINIDEDWERIKMGALRPIKLERENRELKSAKRSIVCSLVAINSKYDAFLDTIESRTSIHLGKTWAQGALFPEFREFRKEQKAVRNASAHGYRSPGEDYSLSSFDSTQGWMLFQRFIPTILQEMEPFLRQVEATIDQLEEPFLTLLELPVEPQPAQWSISSSSSCSWAKVAAGSKSGSVSPAPLQSPPSTPKTPTPKKTPTSPCPKGPPSDPKISKLGSPQGKRQAGKTSSSTPMSASAPTSPITTEGGGPWSSWRSTGKTSRSMSTPAHCAGSVQHHQHPRPPNNECSGD